MATKVWQILTAQRCADDGTLGCGRRSAKYFGVADWRWIFVLGSYFLLLYFHYLWLSTCYNTDETKAAG